MSLEYPGRLPEGALVNDQYRVRESVSSGALGDSYLAERLDTGGAVMLRLVRPGLDLGQQEALRAAFVEEGRFLAAHPHENLLHVLFILDPMKIKGPEQEDAHTVHAPVWVTEPLAGHMLEHELTLHPRLGLGARWI